MEIKTAAERSEIARRAVETRRANAAKRAAAPAPFVAAPIVNADGGMVPLYSCQLVRDSSVNAEDRDGSSARSVAAILRVVIGNQDREHFVVVALDARKRVIGIQTVSVGTLSASLVHPREVFKPVLLLNAAAIIVSHNHPSGDPSPSSEDRTATQRLQRAGELMGVPLVDHIIIGEDSKFFSFRESGLL